MIAYKIELDFEAKLGVRMNKRDAEREGKRLQDAIMNAIDEILFEAAPEPKGGMLLEMSAGRPIISKIDDVK